MTAIGILTSADDKKGHYFTQFVSKIRVSAAPAPVASSSFKYVAGGEFDGQRVASSQRAEHLTVRQMPPDGHMRRGREGWMEVRTDGGGRGALTERSGESRRQSESRSRVSDEG